MPLLVNRTHPFYRIFIPSSGEYAEFRHGRLSIDPGDSGYDVVMAEAERNSLITIVDDEGQIAKAAARFACDIDNLPFASEEELVAHVQAMHADAPVLNANDEALDDTHGGPLLKATQRGSGAAAARPKKGRDQDPVTEIAPAE